MNEQQQRELANLRSTIEPKSDRVNADDFMASPCTVTITGIRAVQLEQPIALDLQGMKQYLPCKSMRRVLIACWGDDGHAWVGRRMTLYCDPDVMFGGVRVGGIRISHLSHIDKPMDLLLTSTRAKRKPVHIEPLPDEPTYPQADFDKNLPTWLGALEKDKIKINALITRIEQKGKLTDEQRRTLSNSIAKAG